MDERFSLFCRMIDAFDAGYNLSNKYDRMEHKYGEDTLYQSESHLISYVGSTPGITVTTIAKLMDKSISACSQIVHRLQKKDLLRQVRNEHNNREYHLELTERGWQIFECHEAFDRECLERTCRSLDEFTDAELDVYIRIQRRINEAFRQDVERSAGIFEQIG